MDAVTLGIFRGVLIDATEVSGDEVYDFGPVLGVWIGAGLASIALAWLARAIAPARLSA